MNKANIFSVTAWCGSKDFDSLGAALSFMRRARGLGLRGPMGLHRVLVVM